MKRRGHAALVGMVGGLAGNGVLGLMFSAEPVRSILYDPTLQSPLFLEITPQRNIPLSVAGLIVLSSLHGVLYVQFAPSIPGHSIWQKGGWWGATIFALYWLPQEWFVYHTLLREPILLNLLELTLLLVGSLVEGIVIASLLLRCSRPSKTMRHADGADLTQ